MFQYALTWVKSFIKKDNGVTAIEYGLISALISVTIIAAVSLVGTELTNTFNALSTAMQTATS